MTEYIDKEKVKNILERGFLSAAFENMGGRTNGKCAIYMKIAEGIGKVIDEIPSVSLEQSKEKGSAYWIWYGNQADTGEPTYFCSDCEKTVIFDYDNEYVFCPFCGKTMKGIKK